MIVAFIPNLSAAEKVVEHLPSPDEVGSQLKILGGPTKQGSHIIQIEGSMPKAIASRILQNIDDLGGDIQAVAG